MMKKFLNIIGIIGLVWLSACSRQNSIPRNVIGLKKMSSILMDMQLAEAYHNTGLTDTNRNINPQHQLKVFDAQILMLHHTDTATFFRSYHFYEHHPDLIQKLYGMMLANINKKSARLDSLNAVREALRSGEELAQRQMEKIRKMVFKYQYIADSLQEKPSRIFKPDHYDKIHTLQKLIPR